MSFMYSGGQSAVTGEHTCMVLKSLNNDEIEVGESGQSGFLAPFYQGEILLCCMLSLCLLLIVGDICFMILSRFQTKVHATSTFHLPWT